MKPARVTEPRQTGLDSPSIPRIKGTPEFSFEDLREQGIALAQMLSGRQWTDFNHHDPGVTLLEALCYALTENVFAAEAPVADILTRRDGQIHYHRNGMQDAEDILPCRPTTEADLLRWLYDRVPTVRNLRLEMQQDAGHNPNGLWKLALRESSGLSLGSVRAEVRRAYWAVRNLGEDLAGPPHLLEHRWCRLRLNLAVDGMRSVADILTEVLRLSADFINAAPQRCRLAERSEVVASGSQADPSSVYEGPVLRHGWVASSDLEADPSNRLHFSDLAHRLKDIVGVAGIGFISLEADGLEAEDGSLQWYGDDWALELYWPEQAQDLAGWEVSRRGSIIKLDPESLVRRFHEDRQVGSSMAGVMVANAAASSRQQRLSGTHLPPYAYYAAFNHLPAIYREPRRWQTQGGPVAQAQFIGYMALLEQWLAHGESQIGHLEDLYTVNGNVNQSMWWQILDGASLPGLQRLYGQQGARNYARQLAVEDNALERRSRVLDHLLALYGESADLPAIQSYGWYYDPDDWQRHLFECKRHWLRHIVRQTRDRNGGLDYSRPSLGRRGNTAALQERLSMLLGMDRHYSRRLNERLDTFGIGVQGTGNGHSRDVPHDSLQSLALRSRLRPRIDIQLAEDIGAGRVPVRLRHYFPETRWDSLSPVFLRCATHADHYWTENGNRNALWVGPDEDGHWWTLPLRPTAPGNPEAPAMYLHELLCRLQRECEGLHLVEHILLRPVSGNEGKQPVWDDGAGLPEDFHAHRISILLPGWTARGASQSFRDLVRDAVSENVPAHLMANVLWLDCAQISLFERVYAEWLEMRQQYCASLCTGTEAAKAEIGHRLNRNTRALGRWLQTRIREGGEAL